MTLIVNEIQYFPGQPQRSRILCVADHQIMRDDSPIAGRQKIFRINRLNATVSYFGLADVNASETFEDLLAHLTLTHGADSIEGFTRALGATLRQRADASVLSSAPSGLHVCGFNASGLPEFWFVRNIKNLDGFLYDGFDSTYTISEELRGFHQSANYDAHSGDFLNPFAMNFANGDRVPFQRAWNYFDGFASHMEAEGVAPPTVTHEDHRKRVEWKMRAIAGYYETFALIPSIGEPITAILLTP